MSDIDEPRLDEALEPWEREEPDLGEHEEPDPWDVDDDDEFFGRPQEEPNCFACSDSGSTWRRGRHRRCRACRPTWFERWYWRLRWRLRLRWPRRQVIADDPWTDPPF